MALDRQSIVRRDFPTQRRGYDPQAVEAHLDQLAAEVEALQRRAAEPATLSQQAGEQVKTIIRAAERGAEEIRVEAEAQAREHIARVTEAADRLRARIEQMERDVVQVGIDLRANVERLHDDLLALQEETGRLTAAAEAERVAPEAEAGAPKPEPAAAEPEAVAPEPEAAAAEAEPVAPKPEVAAPEAEPVAPKPEAAAPEAEPAAPEPEAAAPGPEPAVPEPEPPAPEPRATNGDAAAARIVALDMALSGTPRAETERYLAEHYDVPDREALLDEVYAAAGS